VGCAESQNKKAIYIEKRRGQWDKFKETLIYNNEEIRKTKPS
jgi:hypothetical protein